MANNVRKIRKILNLSVEEVAKMTGYSKPHIFGLEKATEINELAIIKFSDCFKCSKEDITTDDLNIENVLKNNYSIEVVEKREEKEKVKLKYFPDIEASAGSGVDVVEDAEFYYKEVDRTMLEFFTASKKLSNYDNLALIAITGDSMDPVLKKGNWVVVDFTQKSPSESNQIYIIKNQKNKIFVKYVRLKMNGRCDIISANKDYESIMDVDLDITDETKQFEVIGRVIASIRDE